MITKTISCYLLIIFSCIIFQVNCQICYNMSQYDRCSKNSACGCFKMVNTENFGICASLRPICSQLDLCESSNNVCTKDNHICVRHPSCNSNPVCYPISMMDEKICPTTETMNTTTTSTITITTTTSTATTTTIQPTKTKFQQFGTTVAGGNGYGNQLNQLSSPYGIFVDQNKNIFIVASWNHRIIEWKSNEIQGKIIAGGNGQGNRLDQLYYPSDMIVDQHNHSIIIADQGNRRVIRWSTNKKQEILIENIDCSGLTMDQQRFLYVSDQEKNEVRKWNLDKINGNQQGILVAGGNGRGNKLNQLDSPRFIFTAKDHSIYISDSENNRVMKWMKDAREGILVAGGNGRGNNLNQLNGPHGLFVDELNQIYIADCVNDRIMRWYEGYEEGSIVVGGNRRGNESNQLNSPVGLSFDLEGNIYVSDFGNARIIRFDKIN
ncbi:unnamed protein product [Adineta ricciae]|uniref:Uncharacterized protein n=2 Tax=Adineta ricciae TaxID=249248 RepID=A0A815QCC3_ADIRI|nr:unnamed protein product [Adineta ricciae]